jgi:tetratricopeptide (TPR) repeat protein
MLRKLIILSTLAGALMAADPKVVTDAKALNKAGKHTEAITALEGALKTSPKDAVAIKATLGESYLALADSIMANHRLVPREKYPPALRAYRKVLEYDKTNRKAIDTIAQIEGIYKSLGRPIPQ